MNKKFILAAIVILGFFLRAYHVNTYGIWNDEQATILVANGQSRYFCPDLDRFTNLELHSQNTLPHLLEATINDNGNSIAFNLLLHYWLMIFGKSDVSARLLALLFGLLIIPLAYRFASDLFKNKDTALFIAFLFAIHPLFIEYSLQCRAYTMATFFTLLSSYLFYHIITARATTKTYIFYAITVSVSLLTHYLTSYVFIAHGLIFMLSVRDRGTWIKYIIGGVFIIAVFGAWMYIGGLKGFKVLAYQNAMSIQKANEYKPGQTGSAAFTLPANPKNIFTGWVEVWLQLFGNQLEYFDFRVREIAILLILPFFLIGAMIRQKKQDTAATRIIIGLLIMTFTQTLYATADALRTGHCKSFHPLYCNFAVPYAILLLGYAISVCLYNSRLKVVTLAITAAIIAITFVSYIPTFRNAREIYPDKNFHRISANEIKEKYQKGDTVIVKSSIDAKLINLYLPDNKEIDQKIDTNITGLYMIRSK